VNGDPLRRPLRHGSGDEGDGEGIVVLARVKELGFIPPPQDWDIAKGDAFVQHERELWTKYIKLAKIEAQ
jgi:hypothetical protein